VSGVEVAVVGTVVVFVCVSGSLLSVSSNSKINVRGRIGGSIVEVANIGWEDGRMVGIGIMASSSGLQDVTVVSVNMDGNNNSGQCCVQKDVHNDLGLYDVLFPFPC
jgi:hypothetical protein